MKAFIKDLLTRSWLLAASLPEPGALVGGAIVGVWHLIQKE